MSGFLPPPLHRLSRDRRDRQQTPDIIWGPASISPSFIGRSRIARRAMTQMLRSLAVVGLGRRQDLHGAPCLLDPRHRRLRGAMHLDIDLGLDLAPAEQPNAAPGAANHAR